MVKAVSVKISLGGSLSVKEQAIDKGLKDLEKQLNEGESKVLGFNTVHIDGEIVLLALIEVKAVDEQNAA